MAETPSYVLDASVAAKWHLDDEEFGQHALAVLSDYQQGRVSLFAPDNIRYEVAGLIRKAMARRRLNAEDARGAVEDFLSLRLRTVRSDSLVLLAFDCAAQFGCSFYDGLYVALAQAARCPLVLADERLWNSIKNRFPWVIWIEDYGL